jgi:hypothetical protein
MSKRDLIKVPIVVGVLLLGALALLAYELYWKLDYRHERAMVVKLIEKGVFGGQKLKFRELEYERGVIDGKFGSYRIIWKVVLDEGEMESVRRFKMKYDSGNDGVTANAYEGFAVFSVEADRVYGYQ